jgi:hydrogenase maturation protease
MAKLTVLGIGNLLMQDDGVGVRLLEAVRQARTWPKEVEFIDGGVGGLNLMGVIESAERLVVFDAADMHPLRQIPPGQYHIVTAEQLSDDSANRISLHDMSFIETLRLCRQFSTAPADVTILAIQPGQVDHGRGLSAALEREFDRLIQAATALVEEQLHRPP